ncbi:MAG: SAM-dependent methyltransferase [Verrucomicrobiae bacterium]|nr:SAM-dependent methyltransferase [Verrucomicrobiae bacterium]
MPIDSPASARHGMLGSVMSVPPIEQVCEKLAASLADGTFVRLVLSAPIRVEVGPQKVLGRCVVLKGIPHLSLTLRHPTQDLTKNLPLAECAAWLHGQLEHEFRSALLGTTVRDWQFISAEPGSARLIDHQPSRTSAPPREHDRKHMGFLDASARDWLEGLAILDATGKVRASMADKHRQINHYLEILSHLAKECGWLEAPIAGANELQAHNPPSPQQALVIADMGCGKGYLTFGAWHLFHRIGKQPVRILGVEARPSLVATSNKLARQINAKRLEFVAGSIQSASLPPLDALIALHACNTATDDAIRRGIELGAKLIIVAPCCHQQLRPQLGKPEPLAPVLRHGVMAERMAEWVTDGLRALFLEWAGYRTKVMEFVDAGHTPKNLMIAAVRESQPFQDQTIKQRIDDLKEFYGIQQHALDDLLNGA